MRYEFFFFLKQKTSQMVLGRRKRKLHWFSEHENFICILVHLCGGNTFCSRSILTICNGISTWHATEENSIFLNTQFYFVLSVHLVRCFFLIPYVPVAGPHHTELIVTVPHKMRTTNSHQNKCVHFHLQCTNKQRPKNQFRIVEMKKTSPKFSNFSTINSHFFRS